MDNPIDLTGKKFNKLTVLSLAFIKNRRRYWNCQCECGNLTTLIRYSIVSGSTKSCGCLKSINKRLKTISDINERIIGKRFGRLLALSLNKIVKGRTYIECKCDCGNTCIVWSSQLLRKRTRSCSCLHKEVISKRIGDKHPCWNPELTDQERKRNRSLSSGKTAWRKSVKERDNYTCQISEKFRCELVVHHLDNWKDYPDKRFDIENGITLSEEIHKLFHKLYGINHNTKEQFEEFREKYNRKNNMNTIKIPKKEIWDWVEDESTIELKEFATKHDCHRIVYITKKDDKYWEYSIEYSYNYGAQIYSDIDAYKVRPVEVKAIKWEIIND